MCTAAPRDRWPSTASPTSNSVGASRRLYIFPVIVMICTSAAGVGPAQAINDLQHRMQSRCSLTLLQACRQLTWQINSWTCGVCLDWRCRRILATQMTPLCLYCPRTMRTSGLHRCCSSLRMQRSVMSIDPRSTWLQLAACAMWLHARSFSAPWIRRAQWDTPQTMRPHTSSGCRQVRWFDVSYGLHPEACTCRPM